MIRYFELSRIDRATVLSTAQQPAVVLCRTPLCSRRAKKKKKNSTRVTQSLAKEAAAPLFSPAEERSVGVAIVIAISLFVRGLFSVLSSKLMLEKKTADRYNIQYTKTR